MLLRLARGILIVAIFAIAGCGGGGSTSTNTSGGGSTTVTPTKYNLNALVTNYRKSKHSYTLNATNNGNTYQIKWTITPGTNSSFYGTSTHTSLVTVNLYENGTLLVSAAGVSYYLFNPFKEIGYYNETTGYVTIYYNQLPLPTDAKIGDTGTVATEKIYYDSSLITVFGNGTDTWTLDTGPGSDAVFCADMSETTDNGPVTESDCYTTDANGSVSGLKVTLLVNGVTLVFQ